MIIKLLILIALFLVVMPMPALAQTTGATLSLSPSTGTFNKSCSFSLDITLDTGGKQTDGADAILTYDPNKLTASPQIISGTVYSEYPGNNVDSVSGKITISGLASVSSPFSGKGTLATLNFTVKDSASGVTEIKFDFDPNNKSKTTDSNVVERGTVAEILNQVTNGSYTIGTGPCGSTGTAPSAPTTLPGTGTGTRVTQGGQGQVVGSTPSAEVTPMKKLPEGGTQELTATIAIVGSILTILGILGLAFL